MSQRIAATLLFLGLPVTSFAQAPRSVPFVSADLVIGASRHPDRIGDTWFRSRQQTWARLSGAVRIGPKGRIRPVLTVDYSGSPIGTGDDAICIFAPDHSCRQVPQGYSGRGVGLGVRGLVGRYMTVGAEAGTVFYRRRGTYFAAELVGQPGGHLGVVLNARHVELHNTGAGRRWLRHLTIGLRIQ